MKKIVVSKNERDEIQKLFERGNSLKELMICLEGEQNKEYAYLIEKIHCDMKINAEKMDVWWIEKLKKYGAEMSRECFINFDNCEIVEM